MMKKNERLNPHRLLVYCFILLFWSVWFGGAFAQTAPPDQLTSVKIALFVNDISSINEKFETFELEAYLYVNWHDPRLKSEGGRSRYFSGDAAKKQLTEMWRPYLHIKHTRGIREQGQLFLRIDPSGHVFYKERVTLTIETELTIKKFPFDKHRLAIVVEPFVKNYGNIQFVIDEAQEGIAKYAYIQQWKVEGYTSKTVEGQAENKPQYIYFLDYERQYGYFVFKILIPLWMIVILSWLGFWMLRQALVNRAALMMTAMLTMVAFQWTLLSQIPHVSYYTFFDTIIIFSYLTVGFNMILLVLSSEFEEPGDYHIEKWVRKIIPMVYVLGLVSIVAYYFLF